MSASETEISAIRFEAKNLSDKTRLSLWTEVCKQKEKETIPTQRYKMARHKVLADITKVRTIDVILFAECIDNQGMRLTEEERRILVSEFDTVAEMVDDLDAMPRRVFDRLSRVADQALRLSVIIPWVFAPVLATQDEGIVRLLDTVTRFARLLADTPLFGAGKFQSSEHRFLYLLPTIAVLTYSIPVPVSSTNREAVKGFLEVMEELIGDAGISDCMEVRLAALSALCRSSWTRYERALLIAEAMESFSEEFVSALSAAKAITD